ncbi:MAG: hypothetical protein OXC97_07830 [Candidatus Dadabacteria bacterium]|nr:hypothetical protein [Candidatus Dadabacteria bacterium]
MSALKNRKKSFNLVPLLPVFLSCFLVSFAAVFSFQHFYFPQRYADLRAAEMEEVFADKEFFSKRARSVLDTRNDVGYVRLLDSNGVLQKSFGFRDDKGFEKLALRGPDGKTVLLGLKESVGKKFYGDALLWSLIFGSLMGVVFTALIRFISNRAFGFLGEFSGAVSSVARGDYCVRLDSSSPLIKGAGVQGFCSAFNEMVSSLEKRLSEGDATEDPDSDSKRSAQLQEDFRPKIVRSQEKLSEASLFEISENSLDSFDEGLVEVVDIPDEDNFEPEEIIPVPKKEVGDSKETKTDISILVVKISDFENLIKDVSPPSVNSLTVDYRKTVSTAIVSFGGKVEAVLRDELVAFFANTDSAAKLNCVCCAVEIMQMFAGVIDGQKVSTHSDIKLKMGISSVDLSVSAGADIFSLAKPFVNEAKSLCDSSRPWGIMVTTGFRQSISDYLEVRREKVNGKLCYAVTGVEEEALQMTRK